MFIMTLSGPDNSTLVLTFNIYETAFRFSRMGRAAAESVIMFIFLVNSCRLEANSLRLNPMPVASSWTR